MPAIARSNPDHQKPSGDLALGSPSSKRESGVMDDENKELSAKPTLTVAEATSASSTSPEQQDIPEVKAPARDHMVTTRRLVAAGMGVSSGLWLPSSLGLAWVGLPD